MPEPRLSVLMTLYNKGPFVMAAVRSVLDNGYPDFELVVVDDGSADDGPAIVQELNDSRVRFLPSAVNTGRAAAANRGLDAVRGEFVAVLDADDIAYPGRFEKQIRFLDSHPETGIVGSAARVFGSRDRIVQWPVDDHEGRAMMLFQDPILYGSCMYRRGLILRHGLRYREDWRAPGMDYLFLLAIAQHARMANLPEPLTGYRLGEQNFRHGLDNAEVRGRIVEAALKWFGIDADEEAVRMMMMLESTGPPPCNAADIDALWRWAIRLKDLNRARRLFQRDLFERRLDSDWRKWFYVLADTSWDLAWRHMRCEGRLPLGRLYYLIRTIESRRAKRIP